MICTFRRCEVAGYCQGHTVTYYPDPSTIKITIPAVGRMHPQQGDFDWFLGESPFRFDATSGIRRVKATEWLQESNRGK